MFPSTGKSPMVATTFEAAVYAGDLPAVTQCLRHGANVNGTTSSGLSPLMVASGLGQACMVSLLLAAGADVRAVEPGMGNTALHKAALSGSRQVAELLLDHGAFSVPQGRVPRPSGLVARGSSRPPQLGLQNAQSVSARTWMRGAGGRP